MQKKREDDKILSNKKTSFITADIEWMMFQGNHSTFPVPELCLSHCSVVMKEAP